MMTQVYETGKSAAESQGPGGIGLKDSDARDLIALIYEHSGIVLVSGQKSLISSRLHKRLKNLAPYPVPLPTTLAHAIIRNSVGVMTRKLSVTSSQYSPQFLGTSSRRKVSIAVLNSLKVA